MPRPSIFAAGIAFVLMAAACGGGDGGDLPGRAAEERTETNCRGSVPPDIPLGEADPNSLPSPADQQALKDAIDALAVAAGLPQSMIDAAEGG